jgi:predicted alpha/beta-hydrolase family hydrolase
VANAFCDSGLAVLRFDLPFRQARPFGPPPRGSAERDQQALKLAVSALRKQAPSRVFLGGHSYGGRMASILAASEQGLADGLLLLSYPLHPPKRRDQMRTAHFPQLHAPALFVSGTRDGFGTTDELAAALKLIPARTELLTVPAAGHELLTKRNKDALPALIVSSFHSFFSE